jgi:hypothetical protein
VTGNIEHSTFDPSKVQIIIPEEQFQNQAPPDFGAPGSQQPAPAEPEAEQPADDLQKQFSK